MKAESAYLIGASAPRARAKRLVSGRGRYTDDTVLPRMLFAAFVRSPYARARIGKIDVEAALAVPGVRRVLTGQDIARVCRPYRTMNRLFPDMKSPLQYAVPINNVNYQGEPVAIVLADTRAHAEDAAEAIAIEWEPLPAVVDPFEAMLPSGEMIHPDIGTNVCYHTKQETKEVDRCFDEADVVLEETFVFGRHTGVPLETRVIIANFDDADRVLTVRQSHQVPHELQGIYARQLGLAESNVHVICPDVGGAFGIKLQAYNDEIAICAVAVIMKRPIKYQADRLESFLSDIQARDHRITARIALKENGEILGLSVNDVFAIGPYPQFPRSSLQEGFHVIQLTGAPYRFEHYRGELTVVFQNKINAGLYRAVGQPISCAVTERMIDLAAYHFGRDPGEFRLANYIDESKLPLTSPSNVSLSPFSLRRCHEALAEGMQICKLRNEQERLRSQSVFRGIGFAAFVELVNPGPNYYTDAGLNITTQETCVLHLDPSGGIRCVVSLSEFGQGTDAAIGQVVAAGIGVPLDKVHVTCGDSWSTPSGGGSWASRGIMIGSEVGWRAARSMRENILRVAGQVLQAKPDSLEIRDGQIYDSVGNARMSIAEMADIMHYRHGSLPADCQPQVTATSHYTPRDMKYVASVGIHMSHVEVDTETGFVRLLRHGVAHDCGTVINPLLLAEQLRGGAVQGIGSALFEECLYDEDGQLQNGTLADYIVPMAPEIPDIDIFQVSIPWQPGTAPKPKGVGEAGAAGASGAVLNAINDAIRPIGASVAQIPCGPERLLNAIKKSRRANS